MPEGAIKANVSQPFNSVASARQWGREQLQRRCGEDAAFEADVLLAEVLKQSRAALIAWGEKSVDGKSAQCFVDLVTRRAAGEPSAYLLGYREFYGLRFAVTQAVLIPRPDTELLVEAVLSRCDERTRSVVDLGTGSGAIAIALAKMRPNWSVLAVDHDEQALVVAARNAQLLNTSNVLCQQSHWYEQLGNRRFDAIVANPPYVACDAELADEVRHEPATALFAPDQGLADLRAIIQGASRHLQPRGWLFLEHGAAQGAAVQRMFAQANYREITTLRDLAAHERVSLARND